MVNGVLPQRPRKLKEQSAGMNGGFGDERHASR
jgi:hypothetical protein